ncbi:hypothetical protein QC761_0088510 [Podospora bellae-mahoneyi]|uniref:Uncharacterized protein n=1 Tax=Podospora bellae-mahoneyi TaxID=2093777 RepID=A0ABR0FAF1_9PEZI|nr:hypothetical protein QC761_0088510 [Podospora bellae-mahoneyi]
MPSSDHFDLGSDPALGQTALKKQRSGEMHLKFNRLGSNQQRMQQHARPPRQLAYHPREALHQDVPDSTGQRACPGLMACRRLVSTRRQGELFVPCTMMTAYPATLGVFPIWGS